MTVTAEPKQRRRPASARAATADQAPAETTTTEEAAAAPAVSESTPGPEVDQLALELAPEPEPEAPPAPADKPKETPEQRDARCLRSYINRILALKADQKELNEEIKDAFETAELAGFRKKVLKEIIRLEEMDSLDRDELFNGWKGVNYCLRLLGHEQLRLSFGQESES